MAGTMAVKGNDTGYITMKWGKRYEYRQDENKGASFTEDGKQWFKKTVKRGDETKTIYIAECGVEVPDKTSTEPKSDYDKAVDAGFNALDKIMTNKGTTHTDKDDDGSIPWNEMLGHAAKGIVDSFIKPIIKHPIRSLIAGVAMTATAIAFPVVGTIALAVGAVTSTVGLAVAGYQAYVAKTDNDARAAWEDIGANGLAFLLSAIGLRNLSKAHAATTQASTPKSKTKSMNKVDNGLWTRMTDKIKDFFNIAQKGKKVMKHAKTAKKFVVDVGKGVKHAWTDIKNNSKANKLLPNLSTDGATITINRMRELQNALNQVKQTPIQDRNSIKAIYREMSKIAREVRLGNKYATMPKQRDTVLKIYNDSQQIVNTLKPLYNPPKLAKSVFAPAYVSNVLDEIVDGQETKVIGKELAQRWEYVR